MFMFRCALHTSPTPADRTQHPGPQAVAASAHRTAGQAAMPPAKGQNDDDLPPWKRLFHEREQAKQQEEQQQKQQQDQEQQQDQQQEQQEEVPLTELEQQLLLCYRKTFLVAGLGLAGSVWRWNAVTKHKRKDIFLPPRAQALPEAVVQRFKQKAQFRDAVSTIGRQSLYITGIAGLYFGVELGVGLLREKQGADWANTAAAGAVAGGLLGARVPSSMRSRTMAVGTLAGGMMGAMSGWMQQQLAHLVAEQEQQQQQQTQQQQQHKTDQL